MKRRPGKLGWTIIVLALVAIAGFALWRWAVAAGSAGTLDWIDARFQRDRGIELAAEGSYGPHAAQRAEIWVPEGDAPPGGFPLVVFSHGGGWHSGEPEDYRFVARTLGDRGYAVALVGYRLVPDGRFPAMLEDTAASLRWVRDRAGDAGADASRVVLIGHSAGAYNVLMMGLDPQWLEKAGVPERSIAGIVSMAGPADFHPFTKDSSRNAMGHVADPQITQPINFARTGSAPILLMHGTVDDVVRPYNSRNLARALEAEGAPVRLIEYDGMSHAGLVMGLSHPFAQSGKVLDPLLEFIEKSLAQQASVPVQRESR